MGASESPLIDAPLLRTAPPFTPSAGDEPNRLIDTLQRFERGIHICTLRIVHISDAPTLADDFKSMFESGKRREDATNRVERTAAQHGIGHSRHDVLHVVLANDADLAPMTNLLPYPSNRRH